jgi:hypothetical protein
MRESSSPKNAQRSSIVNFEISGRTPSSDEAGEYSTDRG